MQDKDHRVAPIRRKNTDLSLDGNTWEKDGQDIVTLFDCFQQQKIVFHKISILYMSSGAANTTSTLLKSG